jgi:MOSC domain-containing protein YiiM
MAMEEEPGATAPRRWGRVASLNVSDGGVPKRAVAEVVVGADGLAGDRQRNLKYHGGPRRAVCLWALERIEALQGEGHPVTVGSTGENVTLAGLDWERVVPGALLRLGDAVELEITSYTVPCRTIGGSFAWRRTGRISQKTHPGWSRVYAAVRRGGVVRVGDDALLVEPLELGLSGP